MDKINITQLKEHPEHITIIAEWLYEEWGRNLPNGSVTRAENALSTPPDTTGLPVSFIALRGDTPAGVARLVKRDMDTRKELSPWIASVFVPIQYRGQGLGTKLCNRSVIEAKKLGFTKIFLFTPDRESFYSRQGWTTLEHTIYGDKQVVVMQIEPGEEEAEADNINAIAL